MLSDIEFELFYAELDAQSSNVSIGHSEKAQEYIYVIHGKLLVHTERGDYTLEAGDSLVFDSSMDHTYANREDAPPAFIVINCYPGS